ncbi:hypothetical protein BC829DRAFT_387842 [Chytridium lagenaria]|nr:hypothetical protein BC829DRAFT_387842 [Chytridium lagenaria]
MFSFRLGWSSSSQARPFSWSFVVEKHQPKPLVGKVSVIKPVVETFPVLTNVAPIQANPIGRHSTYKAALLSQPPAVLQPKQQFQKSSRFLMNRLESFKFMPIIRHIEAPKKSLQRRLFSAINSYTTSKPAVALPQPRLSRPIVDICRDRRRRITGVKRSMTVDVSRKEIAKALSTSQTMSREESRGGFSPLWARFALIWSCALPAPLALF